MRAQTCTCSHIHIKALARAYIVQAWRWARKTSAKLSMQCVFHHLGQNLKSPLLTIRWQTKQPSIKAKNSTWKHTHMRKHAHNFNLSGLRGRPYARHAAMRTGLSQDLTRWPWGGHVWGAGCSRWPHQHQNVWRLRNLCSAALPDHAAQHSSRALCKVSRSSTKVTKKNGQRRRKKRDDSLYISS